MIDTDERETPKAFAISLTTSSFAAPSTGGAEILTFKEPLSSPITSDLDARGITRRLKTSELSVSVYSINLFSP
jgi:hypothetical protein